jgi:hypothetical protein
MDGHKMGPHHTDPVINVCKLNGLLDSDGTADGTVDGLLEFDGHSR